MSLPSGAAVSGCAYAKMVLHALKHPQDCVCGLLIGTEANECCKRGEVLCTDAVPLLHTHMLHPQLRLGVELTETMCEMGQLEDSCSSSSSGNESKQQIVGFYYSDVLTVPDKGPSIKKEAAHIARVLRQHYPHLLVCLLDFRALSEHKPVTTFWGPSGSSWSRMPDHAIRCSKAAIELAETAVARALYINVADLDDHLSDPSLSPLNGSLLSGFADLIAEDAKCLGVDEAMKNQRNSVSQNTAVA